MTRHISRRAFLAAAGTSAVGGASATVTAGAQPSNQDVIDLGEEGLSRGDVIDPYLAEHFRDDTEVHVPSGAYAWKGGGLGNASGNAALIGNAATLAIDDDAFHDTIRAEYGTIELRGLSVRGAVSEETRLRLEAAEDAAIIADRVHFPDGAVDGAGRAQAIYVPSEHAGAVGLRDCTIAGFSDNGVYACSMGREAGGRVVIDRCIARNNNVAGFRIGGHESELRNSVVINDERAPVPSGIAHNQRGIRVDYSEHTQDVRIANCDVLHTGDNDALGNGGPIRWSSRTHDSTGTIEHVRIHNDVEGIAAVAERREAARGWDGRDVHVVGEGSHDVPEWFEDVHTGADAEAPTGDLADLRVDA